LIKTENKNNKDLKLPRSPGETLNLICNKNIAVKQVQNFQTGEKTKICFKDLTTVLVEDQKKNLHLSKDNFHLLMKISKYIFTNKWEKT
jgi:hypothetical protein